MKLKFNIKYFFIFLLFTTAGSTTNKTFLKFGSTGQNQVLQKNMTSYFIHKNKLKEPTENSHNKLQNNYTHNNFFISTSVFYMQSDNSTALAKYFFPNGKTELTVKGYGAVYNEDGEQISDIPDIYAEWLGIPSSGDMNDPGHHTFSSKIKIFPM